MKLTKSQLQQIIKEELEAYLEEDKDHPGQSCEEAHPGQEHDLYSVTEVSSQKQTDCSDKNNPWAICTASVGRENKEEYEKCVMGVKAKNK